MIEVMSCSATASRRDFQQLILLPVGDISADKGVLSELISHDKAHIGHFTTNALTLREGVFEFQGWCLYLNHVNAHFSHETLRPLASD